MSINLNKYCTQCGQKNPLEITDTEPSFADYEHLIAIPCENCGTNMFNHTYLNTNKIEKHILNIWGYYSNIHFFEQDEDIILAEKVNIELFSDAIENSNYLPSKKQILLTALCVLYYDNTVDMHEYTAEENEKRKQTALKVLPYLKLKKEMIKELPGWLLMDYVKRLVYPVVGISKK